jgi:branched-chain amino acid transport system permease protein
VTELIKMIWGTSPLSVAPPEMLAGSFPLIGALKYPTYRLAIIIAGLVVGLILYLVIARTRAGMRLRAGATDREMIDALGVNINQLFSVVFALGAMLAGFAGAMVAPVLSVDLGMGESVLILAFVVIVIGGIGSIRGAFAAAIMVGVVDTLGRTFGPLLLRMVFEPTIAGQIGRMIAPMLIYIFMAAILVVRPAGLFGRKFA